MPARDAAEKLIRDTGSRGTTKKAGLPIRFPSHLPPNARYWVDTLRIGPAGARLEPARTRARDQRPRPGGARSR